MRRLVVIAMAAALLVAGKSGTVAAIEMRAGGFGAEPEAFFARPSSGLHSRLTFGGRGWGAALSGFTPRSSGLPVHASSLESAAYGLSLGIESGWLDRLLRPVSTTATTGLYGTDSMIVGGALQLEDVAVMGGLGRAQLFGSTTDMVTAGLSYGRIRARFAYGQSGTGSKVSSVRDVMMFSTDLAAWSWLTLEGDLAFGETAGDGDQAIGRLGVKLQF